VGDLFALDAHRRVTERDVVDGQLAEERTSVAHDDRHEVDRDQVEQPQLEALSSDGPAWQDATSFVGSHPVNFFEFGYVEPSAMCPLP